MEEFRREPGTAKIRLTLGSFRGLEFRVEGLGVRLGLRGFQEMGFADAKGTRAARPAYACTCPLLGASCKSSPLRA